MLVNTEEFTTFPKSGCISVRVSYYKLVRVSRGYLAPLPLKLDSGNIFTTVQCTYTVGSQNEIFSIFSTIFIQARYPKYEIKSWESFDNYAPLQSPPRRADRGNEAWSRPHGPNAVDSTTLLSFISRGSEVLTLAGFFLWI